MTRRTPPDAAPTTAPAQRVTRQPSDGTAKGAAATPADSAAAPAAPTAPRPAVKPPLQHGPARRKRW